MGGVNPAIVNIQPDLWLKYVSALTSGAHRPTHRPKYTLQGRAMPRRFMQNLEVRTLNLPKHSIDMGTKHQRDDIHHLATSIILLLEHMYVLVHQLPTRCWSKQKWSLDTTASSIRAALLDTCWQHSKGVCPSCIATHQSNYVSATHSGIGRFPTSSLRQ